jgi:23S rRNA G2069 N7-methylase RlmK/C1962 C5-methylase RlmI
VEERTREQADMLANRVRKRFNHLRKRFEREGIETFRLFDWDIPEIRAVVDWYAGYLVVSEYTRRQTGPEWLPTVAAAAAEALGVPPDRLHLKRRTTAVADGPRYEPLADLGERFPVRERDLRFLVNLTDRLDTGLFPDHRETRKRLRAMATDTDFLNLYCYTGAFTCAAAAGRARSTVSVDRSSTYVDWVRDNLVLNELDDHRHILVRDDVDHFLDRVAREGRRYNLVLVDPPSFSRSQGTDAGFDIQRDHPDLLRRVLEVTAIGGKVLFSTNHQRFEPRLDGLATSSIEEWTPATIPEDYRNRRVHRCWCLVRA